MSVIVGKELPKGWVETTLDEVSQIKNGFAFKSSQYLESGVPLIRISNIQDSQIKLEENNICISENLFSEFKEYQIIPNDILIALSGATTGKFGVFNHTGTALLNQRVGLIRNKSNNLILQNYIFYFLDTLGKLIISKAYGMAQPNISTNFFKELKITLPPLNEQKRIVTKIEELFSLVDSAKDTLEKTKILLKQYRQSILKHAFEGKLVPQDPNDEPASVLLEKIKKENPEKKFSEVVSEKELPKGWILGKLGDSNICEIIMGQSPPSSTYNKIKNGLPFFQGKKDFGKKFPTPTVWCSKPTRVAKKNDILLSVRAPVGAINWSDEDCCIGRGLSSIRPKINHKFIYYYLKSIEIKLSKSGGGSVFNAITKNELYNLSISIPPLNEQKRIVAKIEESFSLIEKNEILIDQLLIQYSQIKNSILKQAFEGKLVPQDPNDEPAEVLLQRIREEKKK